MLLIPASLCASRRKTAGAAHGGLDQSASESCGELHSRPELAISKGGRCLDIPRIEPFHIANPAITRRGATLNAARSCFTMVDNLRWPGILLRPSDILAADLARQRGFSTEY